MLNWRVTSCFAVVTMTWLVACADDGLEHVRVCGDLAVPSELVAVRVSAIDEARGELAAGVTELDLDTPPQQLPIRVALPAIDGRHIVRAQGIGEDGAEVLRAEVLVDGDLDEIVVNLVRDCLGQACPLGQTCIDGGCTVIPDAASATTCKLQPTIGIGGIIGGPNEGPR